MSLKEALENPESVRERQLAARRALWSRIKSEAGDCAEFIEQATKIFGKPERVVVKLNSGETLDSASVKGGG